MQRYLTEYAAAKPRFDKTDSQGQGGYVTGEALVRVLEAMREPTRQAVMNAAHHLNKVEIGLLLPGITRSDVVRRQDAEALRVPPPAAGGMRENAIWHT